MACAWIKPNGMCTFRASTVAKNCIEYNVPHNARQPQFRSCLRTLETVWYQIWHTDTPELAAHFLSRTVS